MFKSIKNQLIMYLQISSMKKVFILVIFLFAYFGLCAQDKITGFGKLKLGSPITIIYEMGYDVKPVTSMSEYVNYVYEYNFSTDIYEILSDSTQKSRIPETPIDHRVKTFVVPKYAVTDNIEIKGIKLKFFNDSLISIQCNANKDLEEALTLKYGEPKKDLREKEHQFTYTYTGNTVTKIDRFFTTTWETNDKNISCTSVLMSWYSDNGKENIKAYVLLSNNLYINKINDAEIIIRKRIKDRELSQKKQSLDSF
jgi:hypothetical protein